MASVRSLGLREPTGLSALIAEGYLPTDPSPESYEWRTYSTRGEKPGETFDDEILIAGSCVVWSRSGIVKRVLNLEAENESIVAAFTTSFASKDEDSLTTFSNRTRPLQDAALVVILQKQALIFQLSGDSQVISLPFEVQCGFPCPYGFLLQRTTSEDERSVEDAPMTYEHDLSTINESQATVRTNSNRPSLVLPDVKQNTQTTSRLSTTLPRTYSCGRLGDELGLVVYSKSSKVESMEDCKALPPVEELVYLTHYDELALQIGSSSRAHEPLCIAVTCDIKTRNLSIWHVAREIPINIDRSSTTDKKAGKGEERRRKSSNIHGRRDGAATPITRPSRDSFSTLAQSYADNLPNSSANELKPSTTDDMANQLGPEFEQAGVQTRSSRRVSSMLARTDLTAGHDRGAFHDLAAARANRKSLNRGRQTESIGSFGDRQSFGLKRRSSFAATTSIISNSTSFLNVPGRLRFDDSESLYAVDGMEDVDHIDVGEDLPRDIGFFKVTTVALSDLHQAFEEETFKVLVLTSSTPQNTNTIELSVCVMGQRSKNIAIVGLQVAGALQTANTTTPSTTRRMNRKVKPISVRRGSGIDDVGLITDGVIQRLMILTETRQGQPSLQLEAPWSVPFTVELPSCYKTSSTAVDLQTQHDHNKKDRGVHRLLSAVEVNIVSITGNGNGGLVVLTDSNLKHHILSLSLAPQDPVARDVISVSSYIFGRELSDGLLVCYWEILRWLTARKEMQEPEWTAVVVLLFIMAVPFIDTKPPQTSTPQKKKKGGLLRSSSGSAIDLTHFNDMMEKHSTSKYRLGMDGVWSWVWNPKSLQRPDSSPTHKRSPSGQSNLMEASHDSNFVSHCIQLAREFVQSPAGEAATGPEGYLPTSMNKDREQRQTALAKVLLALHLLREEYKLDITRNALPRSAYGDFVAVLAQLGMWLGWDDWTLQPESYYRMDVTNDVTWSLENMRISGLEIPAQPFQPPSILAYISACLHEGQDQSFTTLQDLRGMKPNTATSDWSVEALQLTPRTCAILSLMRILRHDTTSSDEKLHATIRASAEHVADYMPEVVSIIVQNALKLGQKRGKELMSRIADGFESSGTTIAGQSSSKSSFLHRQPTHIATKDFHLVSNSALESETLQRWDASSEIERHAITRLLFHEDRRFQEASKLVNQTRPPIVDCTPEPHWSESDLLEAQKELAQFVTRRTLSVASGRGMMHFEARTPLLTERVPIPAFSLQCIMKPRNASESTQAMTFSADKAAFTEDKVCWAFFHNGASAGLMISRNAKGIDTSWILYNKPPELTNRHAGFLLALGLNGHLKSLAKWVAFKYLTPKHTMTSIGLLLGLAASYIGTQDQRITRLMSVHVTRLLPPGAAELNLSPLTQTTGIIGVGLLYHNSGHRRMSEVMLSELENKDSEEGTAEDSILRDEGYRLAAGFSLGLINLGRGKELHSLQDLAVTERLMSIAIGTKNVNLVHVLDRATAGAVMAVAFIFLKTNDANVAAKIDIPDTMHQFDYVRPDTFLLRTVARHLIMWDFIQPTHDFIINSLPLAYRRRGRWQKSPDLATEEMPFFNIIAGICFAIGLRFAGSQRHDVRDLLVDYLDNFLHLSRLPCENYDARVSLNSVRNCLDVIALATATVMAGTGDLIVMRRLRALHGRTDRDTPFGSHMAAHMALGTLFLGGGTMTFGTSNLAIAALCMAFYPLFPNDVLDNKTHLQALRHLWVLAAEGRCLIARSSEAGGNVIGGVEARITFKTGVTTTIKSPSLLPNFTTIDKIEVNGDGYYPLTLDFSNPSFLQQIEKDQAVNVTLSRRPVYDKPAGGDPLLERMDELEEARQSSGGGVPSVNPNVANRHALTANERNPFRWTFDLDSFKEYGYTERDLVLNSMNYVGKEGKKVAQGTVVDLRLEMERGVLPERRGEKVRTDALWELRLLFEAGERFGWWDEDDDNEEERAEGDKDEKKGVAGLRKEVVERLKERVWEYAREVNSGGG